MGFHAGMQEIPTSTQEAQNLRSARNNPDVVTKLIQEEVHAGFLLSPFDKSPFRSTVFHRWVWYSKSIATNCVLF